MGFYVKNVFTYRINAYIFDKWFMQGTQFFNSSKHKVKISESSPATGETFKLDLKNTIVANLFRILLVIWMCCDITEE